MIKATAVGLGKWGRVLVDAVQGKSDKIHVVAGLTQTSSDDAKAFAQGHDLNGARQMSSPQQIVLDRYPVLGFSQIRSAAFGRIIDNMRGNAITARYLTTPK